MPDHDPTTRAYTVPCAFVTGDLATTFQQISADLKDRYGLAVPVETLAAQNTSLTDMIPGCQVITIPLPGHTPAPDPAAVSEAHDDVPVERVTLDLSSYPAFVKSYRKVFLTDPTPETFDLMLRMRGASSASDPVPSAPSPAPLPSGAGAAQPASALPDDLGYPEACACAT